ncbi:hypothetical protein Pelo_1676 [Pelomyxa schiedti]|nr:hypothetical protein Pelo_1676 [Pelomyxa schiedti]
MVKSDCSYEAPWNGGALSGSACGSAHGGNNGGSAYSGSTHGGTARGGSAQSGGACGGAHGGGAHAGSVHSESARSGGTQGGSACGGEACSGGAHSGQHCNTRIVHNSIAGTLITRDLPLNHLIHRLPSATADIVINSHSKWCPTTPRARARPCYVYRAPYSTSTMTKVRVSDGATVASAPLPNAGHTNQSAWSWGGYTDICWYVDAGGVLFVVHAPPDNNNIHITRVDPANLAILKWEVPRVKRKTGLAFVGGKFYFGKSHN